MDFCIKAWSFWQANAMDESPALTTIPAMQKRRMSKLTRQAFHVALQTSPTIQTPCIFASRHGDLHKTVELLKNIARQEDLSPTQFSLSVHNAISGLFSIYTANRQDSNAIAAGINSLHYAVLEGAARLATEPELSDILIVYADEPVPEPYSPYCNDPEKPVALALLLSSQSGEPVSFHYQHTAEDTQHPDPVISLLPFLSGEQQKVSIVIAGKQWSWQRD